ncbi:MAG: hypothetical protein ACYCTW_02035 [Sulfuricella sp.]
MLFSMMPRRLTDRIGQIGAVGADDQGEVQQPIDALLDGLAVDIHLLFSL